MIHIRNATSGDELFSLSSRPAKVLSVVLYADRRLATAGSDNKVRLWDLATKRQIDQLDGHSGSVTALVCHENLLISGSYDTTVRLWTTGRDADQGKQARRSPSGGALRSATKPTD